MKYSESEKWTVPHERHASLKVGKMVRDWSTIPPDKDSLLVASWAKNLAQK